MRKSFVWKYFSKETQEAADEDDYSRASVRCNMCGSLLTFLNKSTSSMRRHLALKHKIEEGPVMEADVKVDDKNPFPEEFNNDNSNIADAPFEQQSDNDDNDKDCGPNNGNSGGKASRSWVWSHFSTVTIEDVKQRKCDRCGMIFKFNHVTSSLARHLRTKHDLNADDASTIQPRRKAIKREAPDDIDHDGDEYIEQACNNNNSAARVKNESRRTRHDVDEENMGYDTLVIRILIPHVYNIELNRVEQSNALNKQMLTELQNCFEELADLPDCRVIILSGAGDNFSTGIDPNELLSFRQFENSDMCKRYRLIYKSIRDLQESVMAIEKCTKPVIAIVHGACVGHALDLLTATDMRFCSKDAYFQVKEIDCAMVPDIGTLQRLPKIIGSQSLVRELCFTGRVMPADEAQRVGLVSRVFDEQESLINGTLKIARTIANKSSVAIQGTKKCLNYARDHSVEDGLEQVASWNAAMMQGDDFSQAILDL